MTKRAAIVAGLTLRKGKQEVNVHSVKDGVVYYGKYSDEAMDAAGNCVALLQCPLKEFKLLVNRALKQGARIVR